MTTQAPSEAAISAAADSYFEFIAEKADLAASYARSVGEAAWRGDRATVGVHLKQLRLTAIALLQAYNEIGVAT